MSSEQMEMYKIFKNMGASEAEAERLSILWEAKAATISDLKQIFLTKDDKIDLLNRMDLQFKALIGILLTAILTVGGTIITLAIMVLNKLK